MSPRPRQGSECRSRQPSARSGASARCTSSSERAPPGCDPRVGASGERRGPARPRREAAPRPRRPHRCSQQRCRAAPRRRFPTPRRLPAKAGGTAGDADSSNPLLARGAVTVWRRDDHDCSDHDSSFAVARAAASSNHGALKELTATEEAKIAALVKQSCELRTDLATGPGPTRAPPGSSPPPREADLSPVCAARCGP
jgi:hypothetical protein